MLRDLGSSQCRDLDLILAGGGTWTSQCRDLDLILAGVRTWTAVGEGTLKAAGGETWKAGVGAPCTTEAACVLLLLKISNTC
ncbi:hypothetical protein DPMN_046655 [Dreissena polymorpha]|uniref:Uncharacterized protein n=1 Tax=Dreissena polymorpha TaxID=45954 RepID=A0A9D4D6K7_DREPO|nr:hypothetical protein DPMN_046655 [Dreissena polymorpha]